MDYTADCEHDKVRITVDTEDGEAEACIVCDDIDVETLDIDDSRSASSVQPESNDSGDETEWSNYA